MTTTYAVIGACRRTGRERVVASGLSREAAEAEHARCLANRIGFAHLSYWIEAEEGR
jgi:hypothetical protein